MDYRIEQLRFQVREDPSSRHFYQLGELLRRQGELEDAVEVLRAGLEYHPEYVAAWVSLGRALFQAERFDESRSAFSRALELDRPNAVAATMLGRAAARVGDWAQAAEALDLATALVPSDEELAREAEEARSHLEPETSAGGETLPEGSTGTEGQVATAAGGPETGPEAEERPVEEPIAMESSPVFPAAVPRSRELAFVSEEDPWSVAPRGDTGVFLTGEDVFATVSVAEGKASEQDVPSPEGLAPAGPGTASTVFETSAAPPVAFPRADVGTPEKLPQAEVEGPEEAPLVEGESPEGLSEVEVEAPEEVLPVEDEPSEQQPEAEVETPFVPGGAVAAMAAGPEAGELEAAETVELPGVPEEVGPPEPGADATVGEIPLPTATLARLALEQGDLSLAERTARAVLERNPDSGAAQEVLETVARRRSEATGTPGGRAHRKIEILENWLGRLRRAAGAGVS